MSKLQTYVNMSAKAIEVQKLHNPSLGDRYVCACESCRKNIKISHYIQDYDMDNLNKRDLTDVEPHYANLVRSADTCTFVAFYHGRCDEDLSYIWLPTQSQLQGMIKNKREYSWHLLERFNGWVIYNSPKTEYFKQNFSNFSMEQLWLIFIMKEKFNKIWDGEDWILNKD
jgi:hypothetical protein